MVDNLALDSMYNLDWMMIRDDKDDLEWCS